MSAMPPVGGRYYALASAEVVRWIGQSWGIAAFIDAGNAADHVHDLKPAYGYGVGGRIRTPIGPFRLDVAYGEARQRPCMCICPWTLVLMITRRGMLAILAGLAVLALLTGVLIGGAMWFLSSESGLAMGRRQGPLALTGGKLKLEGTTGSLAGTTHIARLTYTDQDLDFIAENVEFTWSPRALFSRSVVIDSSDRLPRLPGDQIE